MPLFQAVPNQSHAEASLSPTIQTSHAASSTVFEHSRSGQEIRPPTKKPEMIGKLQYTIRHFGDKHSSLGWRFPEITKRLFSIRPSKSIEVEEVVPESRLESMTKTNLFPPVQTNEIYDNAPILPNSTNIKDTEVLALQPSIPNIDTNGKRPLHTRRPPGNYIFLPCPPYSRIHSTFRQGPIKLAKEPSIETLTVAIDEVLVDWTAFHLATMGGAGNYLDEPVDYTRPSRAELDEIDDLFSWFSEFGFDGPGTLVRQSS